MSSENLICEIKIERSLLSCGTMLVKPKNITRLTKDASKTDRRKKWRIMRISFLVNGTVVPYIIGKANIGNLIFKS